MTTVSRGAAFGFVITAGILTFSPTSACRCRLWRSEMDFRCRHRRSAALHAQILIVGIVRGARGVSTTTAAPAADMPLIVSSRVELVVDSHVQQCQIPLQ